MRFSSLFVTLAGLCGFMAEGLAAPDLSKRSQSVATVYGIVEDIQTQFNAVSKNVTASLNGITPSSPLAQRQAAAAKVTAQLNAITGAVQKAITQVQSGGPVSSQKRQATPPSPSTSDLINAISALVTQIDGLIEQAIAALGDASLVGPAAAFITTVSALIVGVAAVVIDFLPFLPDIASVLSAVGTLLSGIGSLIPK